MFAHLMLNTLLALLWCFLVEDFRGVTFIAGWLIGMSILFVVRGLMGEIIFFRKVGVFVKLMLVFAVEIVVANLQVAWWILRPRLRVQPAMIRLPIELKSDAAIATLASMISLTPGTVTVDVSRDRQSLDVHCLNIADIEDTKRVIKEKFEKPLKELEQ